METIKKNLYILGIIHKASPNRLIFAVLRTILSSVSSFLFDVFMLRYILNSVQAGISFIQIMRFVLFLAALYVLSCVVRNYYIEIYSPKSDQRITSYIEEMVFRKAYEMDISSYENPTFYDLYIKSMEQAAKSALQLIKTIEQTVSSIVLVLTVSFFIFQIEPMLYIFVLFPLLVKATIGNKHVNVKYKNQNEMQEKMRKANYVKRVVYMADYAMELRLSSVFEIIQSQFKEAIAELRLCLDKYCWKDATYSLVFSISTDIVAFFGAIAFASYKTIVAKTMMYGDCIVVINAISTTVWSFRSLADTYNMYFDNALYIEKLQKFLKYSPKISMNENGLLVSKDNYNIHLRNVSYKYCGKDQYSIKNITMDIPQNKKIAIAGLNGAGKSTTINLILGLYQPSEGEILFGGLPVSAYNLESYREAFGVVFQDYKVFAMSVLDNILLQENVNSEDVTRAKKGLELSGLYHIIDQMPQKMDSILTKEFDEKGIVLSGGNYQKLAIARAYAKRSRILIFDEPSSSLDPIAEHQLFQAIFQSCNDKTIIFISHRLTSTILADTIYYFQNGEIIEHGTHNELMEANGEYALAFRTQAKSYEKEK